MSEPTPANSPAPGTEAAADDAADELEPVRTALDSLDSMPTADHLAVYTRIADGLADRLDTPVDDDAQPAPPDGPSGDTEPGRLANG